MISELHQTPDTELHSKNTSTCGNENYHFACRLPVMTEYHDFTCLTPHLKVNSCLTTIIQC